MATLFIMWPADHSTARFVGKWAPPVLIVKYKVDELVSDTLDNMFTISFKSVPTSCSSEEDCEEKIADLNDRIAKIEQERSDIKEERDEIEDRFSYGAISYSEVVRLGRELAKKDYDLMAEIEEIKAANTTLLQIRDKR